jgi:hypothetical protein
MKNAAVIFLVGLLLLSVLAAVSPPRYYSRYITENFGVYALVVDNETSQAYVLLVATSKPRLIYKGQLD